MTETAEAAMAQIQVGIAALAYEHHKIAEAGAGLPNTPVDDFWKIGNLITDLEETANDLNNLMSET